MISIETQVMIQVTKRNLNSFLENLSFLIVAKKNSIKNLVKSKTYIPPFKSSTKEISFERYHHRTSFKVRTDRRKILILRDYLNNLLLTPQIVCSRGGGGV